MSHANRDVEYYRFDYQLYKRIQLRNFLVVLWVPIALFVLKLQLMKKKKKKKKKKKMKTGSFEARLFLSGICSLAFRSVYSKTVLYSALLSLLSAVFCVFWNFAPIPMHRENKAPCAITT